MISAKTAAIPRDAAAFVMDGVNPLPRVARIQLVTIDQGLGTVELQYLDADGDAHELAMNIEEAERLFSALRPLENRVG